MDCRFSRVFRIICSGVLFFFLWTFELSGIAYAIKNDTKPTAETSTKTKPAKRSGKNIEDLYDILKSTADTDTIKSKVKAKRAEIDADNTEIRKTFAATEKTLTDKGLPPAILERHRKFVKQYEDNFKILQTNLDATDKAKSKAEADTEIEKTRVYLAKVKSPTKHKPLDPNKLPFRTEEPVFKQPRTSPEEFQKEQKTKLAKGSTKPLLIASNGSLNGLLAGNTQFNTKPSDSLPAGSFQVALKFPPTQDDLSESSEIQFTPAIRAKAVELNNHPRKIYEWVRNNIDYVPTYGSIQGADMCLQTKQCNDMDTASLLIALLRVSGVPAKYVYGTIERKIEDTMNWVGGFTDPMAALNFIASAGIPVGGITEGGTIKKVQMEHVWVETWIQYFPSRGAIHKPGQGDMWIPIDASYKQFKYMQGFDIKTAVPFDSQSFIDQIKSSATINEAAGYVTNVNSSLVQQSMQDYQTRVQTYITQNYPNATIGDVLGKKEIIKQEFPYLMGTLNNKVLAQLARYSVLPDTLRHKVSFSVTSDNILYGPARLNITRNLAEVAGKKVTLSYAPATSADEAVINSYLPKPHSDGTPIQPSELPSSLPAYLIQLKPELRIDGAVVGTGGAIGMGEIEDFTIIINPPNASTQVVNNKVTAGEYNAVALDLARTTSEGVAAIKTKLEATKVKLNAQDITGLSKDDIMGDILYATVLTYFGALDTLNYVSAHSMGVLSVRLPSVARFFNALSADYLFGVPLSISAGGLAMDAGLVRSIVRSPDGKRDNQLQFMLASGLSSSALEHSIPEKILSTPDNAGHGISAVKALKLAAEQGIPIYTINKSNIGTILPQLQLTTDTITDIQNAVNTGKTVSVSKANISYNGWTGCGYIIIDPNNGAGAYMISGGFAGSGFSLPRLHPLLLFFIGAVLTGIGIFAGLGLGVALAIAGIIVGLYDLISNLLSIYNNPNLTQAQKDDIAAVLAFLFAIGAIIAIVGIFAGASPIFIAVALIWSVLAIMASMIIDQIVNLISSNQSGLLYWRRRQWVA
jgi:transglutaminase-like putative cysteine protease